MAYHKVEIHEGTSDIPRLLFLLSEYKGSSECSIAVLFWQSTALTVCYAASDSCERLIDWPELHGMASSRFLVVVWKKIW